MSTEKIYKNFVFLVNQIVNTALSILKVIVQSKYNNQLPKAKKLNCIVLANGPSLKQSLEKNLNHFIETPLICVNTFALTDEFVKLKPTYYIMLDPFFWEKKNETVIDTFSSLALKTTWCLYLFIPKHALNKEVFINLKNKNNNIHIVPFNYTVFKGFPTIAHWFYRKNLAMPQSLNVTIAALFIGINIGFKEIKLVGADHTWHENLHMSNENVLHSKVPHFYENEVEVKYVPFYKGGHVEKGTQKAHEFFNIWSRTFYAYILINEYAISRNCTIYNASEISFIDAFKRCSITNS
ncbi:MAG: 6-hydroxymethylpterin diphosphokinase MptE-like protein [Bacteroidia bacterium]